MTVVEALTVDGNDNITLTSETGNDGSTYTISGNSSPVISISAGSLNFKNGSVEGAANYFCDGVKITGGKFIMENGSVSAYTALVIYGGKIYISGGNVASNSNQYCSGYGLNAFGDGEVELTGGSYYGEAAGIANADSEAYWIPVNNLLGEGYAYKQGDSWLSSDSIKSLLVGTVTVEKAPIQSVSVSSDKTAVTYGDTAPDLNATVKQLEGSTDTITYQWYQNGTEITGATEATYTPGRLEAGEYTYTCKASADGYSLTSAAVTVTVEKKELDLSITCENGDTTKSYDGTTTAPDGLSVEIKNAVAGDDVTAAAASYTYNSARSIGEAEIASDGSIPSYRR